MKQLLIAGSIYNLLFAIFHILFWKIFRKTQLNKLDFLNRGIMQVLNLCLTFCFLIFNPYQRPILTPLYKKYASPLKTRMAMDNGFLIKTPATRINSYRGLYHADGGQSWTLFDTLQSIRSDLAGHYE